MKLRGQYDDLNAHKAAAKVMLDQQRLDFEDEYCLSFDLMQVQPLPHLNVNKAFYNGKMWMYNFGIHLASSDRITSTKVRHT